MGPAMNDLSPASPVASPATKVLTLHDGFIFIFLFLPIPLAQGSHPHLQKMHHLGLLLWLELEGPFLSLWDKGSLCFCPVSHSPLALRGH